MHRLDPLFNCAAVKRWENRGNLPMKHENPKPKIDWEIRRSVKKEILHEAVAWLISIYVFILLFLFFPLINLLGKDGIGIFYGSAPMAATALSWILIVSWAWDKNREIFFTVTIGSIPFRTACLLVWFYYGIKEFKLDFNTTIFAAMVSWILFTIIEMSFFVKMSKRLIQTGETE